MIKEHWPLTDSYGDLINFLANRIHEPIIKQYLYSYPKNATHLSNTKAKSLLGAINFYYESENLDEICDASFLFFMLMKLRTHLTINVLQCF